MKMYICKLCTANYNVVLVQILHYNCPETDYSFCVTKTTQQGLVA